MARKLELNSFEPEDEDEEEDDNRDDDVDDQYGENCDFPLYEIAPGLLNEQI